MLYAPCYECYRLTDLLTGLLLENLAALKRVKKKLFALQTFPSVFTDALPRDVVTPLAMTRVTVTSVGAADAKSAL